MENTKYGRRREGGWTPIRAKAQDTRANPNSWKTHLVRKRWDIGLLRALIPRIMMMMMMMKSLQCWVFCSLSIFLSFFSSRYCKLVHLSCFRPMLEFLLCAKVENAFDRCCCINALL